MKKCVDCAFPVDSLHTQYGQGIVLDICGNCKQFVDPYIEHSGLLLLIDLFLLKPSVYRHVLFNKDIGISQQLGLAIILVSVEAVFSSTDEIRTWDDVSHLQMIKMFHGQLSELFIFFGSVVLVASIFDLLRSRRIESRSVIRMASLVLNATILSLIPSLVLLAFTIVFRNSYGALPPRLTSPLSHLPSSIISSYPRLSRSIITQSFEEALKSGVGIDMDQLGSAELKQTLIRGVVGNLSTSMGISVALGSPWWIGGLVLTISYVTKWLLTLLLM
ncbi:hypothetical protein CROQUDRAFT_653814 [Cronartium quercuum f. sp. fusiforme G11]|uniref:Protein ARV n=1 Tax=Cronartium quercuum f. sp. fusiforme G11 TaxID=708437 RepID=A0A9P6TEV4_9BASI|nr:hypothetical protein CROQUDRAFT_653814 [Cronartium quercuum f. sp. fusiforme G11]